MSNNELDKQTLDASMEEAAFEAIETPLDAEGNPETSVLDLSTINKKYPNHKWYNVEDPDGNLHAIKMLKGDIIHFMDTMDDADILALAEEDSGADVDDLSTQEKIKIARVNRLYTNTVIQNFVLEPHIPSPNDLPRWLRSGIMAAYDDLNGISATSKVVNKVKKK